MFVLELTFRLARVCNATEGMNHSCACYKQYSCTSERFLRESLCLFPKRFCLLECIFYVHIIRRHFFRGARLHTRAKSTQKWSSEKHFIRTPSNERTETLKVNVSPYFPASFPADNYGDACAVLFGPHLRQQSSAAHAQSLRS